MIAAVSGGIDSVVLLDILAALRETMKLEVVVAHFNHQLRGQESDEDEEFVRNFSASLGVDCYVEGANSASVAESRKLSVQEAARELRYTFFDKLRSSGGFYKIATAHNANDNAETILFNVIRGAGVRGLAGISVWRKDLSVVRPLLNSKREDIESYGRERRLAFRIDHTNQESEYTRNFLRNSIIPVLMENVNPNLVGTLRRTGELFDELDRYLMQEAQRFLETVRIEKAKDEVVLDIDALHRQPVFMQEYLLLTVARDFARKEIDFSTVKAMVKVSHAETGTSCSLAGDRILYRDRNRLVFRPTASVSPFCYKVEPEKRYEFGRFLLESQLVEQRGDDADGFTEYVDADRLGTELVVRSWSDGDWFCPLGMKGKKKLSDFFIDEKVPMYEKHSIPVFASDGTIVWVCGMRLDDRFKLTAATKRVLRLQYSPCTGHLE